MDRSDPPGTGRARPVVRHRVIRLLLLAAVTWVLAAWWLAASSGIGTLLVLTLLCGCLTLTFGELFSFAARRPNRRGAGLPSRLLLCIGSVGLTLIAFEAFLQLESDPAGGSALTIPTEWQRREVEVAGARRAFIWHGKLHVLNEDAMRRTTPFPPRDPAVYRIMVVGDSMTYGYGVAEEDTYPRVIERELREIAPVEVLNLGVGGDQSEDILDVIREFTPRLAPDLVVYGVCLNDLLPSDVGQYETRPFPFPLPHGLKKLMVRKTRVGQFFHDRYDRLLMTIGGRPDFFDDILQNFDGYRTRFAADVRAMNDYVISRGLPPIVAMVLHQYPAAGSKGNRVALAAERYLVEAGMDVVGARDYLARYDGVVMHVSPWEGHPNEEAHRIFAEQFLTRLRPALERHAAARPGAGG